jgi:hypothetical protein
VRSITADEVEGLVLAQVRRLLASLELVARIITAVRRENGAAEAPLLDEVGALEPVWDELYPTPSRSARDRRKTHERQPPPGTGTRFDATTTYGQDTLRLFPPGVLEILNRLCCR